MMNTMIKAAALAATILFSSSAMAGSTVVCNGSGVNTDPSASSNFIVSGFAVKCSANTHMFMDQDTTKVAVCAASKKGNRKFGGTSEGGAVADKGACAAAACVATDAAAVLASGC